MDRIHETLVLQQSLDLSVTLEQRDALERCRRHDDLQLGPATVRVVVDLAVLGVEVRGALIMIFGGGEKVRKECGQGVSKMRRGDFSVPEVIWTVNGVLLHQL